MKRPQWAVSGRSQILTFGRRWPSGPDRASFESATMPPQPFRDTSPHKGAANVRNGVGAVIGVYGFTTWGELR